jgi:transposase InsO family protein
MLSGRGIGRQVLELGVKKRIYKNREIATAEVFDYIESFYNRTRRHSHLGGVSPEEFESAAKRHPGRVH